jgi:hypothetical protein
MSTEPEPVHFVTVEHERDKYGDVVATTMRFECRGTIDSPCHLYPDDVESFSEVPEEQWTKHQDCWIRDWFDTGDEDVTPYWPGDGLNYGLHNIPDGSGPIDYEYDECILWHWVDAPMSTPQVEQLDIAAEATSDRLAVARRIAGQIRSDVVDRSRREDALVALNDEVARLEADRLALAAAREEVARLRAAFADVPAADLRVTREEVAEAIYTAWVGINYKPWHNDDPDSDTDEWQSALRAADAVIGAESGPSWTGRRRGSPRLRTLPCATQPGRRRHEHDAGAGGAGGAGGSHRPVRTQHKGRFRARRDDVADAA